MAEKQEKTEMDPAGAKRVAQWRDSLERACGFDSWGQVVEACDEYERLAKNIRNTLGAEELRFTEEEQKFLNKVAVVALSRTKAAQDLTGNADNDLTVEMVRKLVPALKDIVVSVPFFPIETAALKKQFSTATLPVPQQQQQAQPRVPKAIVEKNSDDEDDDVGNHAARSAGGSLLPRKVFNGGTSVCIRIEKIKLKDNAQYLEPYFTVTLRDGSGEQIQEAQDTPPTNTKDDFIHFNQDVYIQVPLEKIPNDGAIFFEFKHFKPKKQRTSTKCWCFMEKDELKPGPVPLEIYAKPTDIRRKKLHLLTEKANFLHVNISLSES